MPIVFDTLLTDQEKDEDYDIDANCCPARYKEDHLESYNKRNIRACQELEAAKYRRLAKRIYGIVHNEVTDVDFSILVQQPVSSYFIICRDKVKIGRSNNVKYRMSSMQVGNPFPLVLAGICNRASEAYLHEHFKAYHHQGDWYRLSDSIKNFIRRHCEWYSEEALK